MPDNPYSAILRLLGANDVNDAQPAWVMGTVKRIKPIGIDVLGLMQDSDTLKINADLVEVLAIGDRVLLLSGTDLQSFIILCKVVDL